MQDFSEKLDILTREGTLFKSDNSILQCTACAHRCHIQAGKRGICQMRTNIDGKLFVPWGYVAAANIDPIEKKPFMHFLPGCSTLTIGKLGCNFHCDFCQNWISSQTLRDPTSTNSLRHITKISPDELVGYALSSGSEIVVSSYNEPLITTEWAIDIFKAAKEKGLKTAYVSNGFASPEVLHALRPFLDGFKIDLKCLSGEKYRSLGGRLEAITDTIKLAHDLNFWVEVVTLIIPTFNDSNEELWDTAKFLTSISRDIPWHVTAFYPAYKHLNAKRTPPDTLQRAAEIGQEAGLHFVYAGNLPGRVGSLENTYCPLCQMLLIERIGYSLRNNHVTESGTCPNCSQSIAGIWG